METIYEKVNGKSKDIYVWIVTQLSDPVAVYAALPLSRGKRSFTPTCILINFGQIAHRLIETTSGSL